MTNETPGQPHAGPRTPGGTGWHLVRPLSPGVWLISEPHHVHSFLILGRDRAVLADTGLGIGDIAAAVASITSAPVTVVNTHHHFDHVGGNHQFTDTAIHHAGAAPLSAPVPAGWLHSYARYAAQMAHAWQPYAATDASYFRLIDEDHLPRPLPAGFSWGRWHIGPPPPTQLLTDGDVLDLGGRSLRVLHTPGHTSDSICLLDEKEGLLFAGDTLVTGPHYAHMPDSDLHQYCDSLDRLAEHVAPALRAVLVCHMLRHTASPDLITRARSALHATVAGTADPVDSVDIFGDRVLEYWDHGLSVVTPAASARPCPPQPHREPE